MTEVSVYTWSEASQWAEALADTISAQRARSGERTLAVMTGGWSSWKVAHLWRFACFERLCGFADRRFREKFGSAPYEMDAWAVVLPRGAEIRKHDHVQATWSASYYPEGCQKGGRLHFEDGTVVQPEQGCLVVFPGKTVHWVEPHDQAGDRLSIAFNAYSPDIESAMRREGGTAYR